MTVEIPKVAIKVLSDLTGEPRMDLALLLTLRDTIEQRLEKIAVQCEAYEDKYGMEFRAFKPLWDAEQVANQYAYEVERDYLEWEGLVTRQAKLEETYQWLT